MGFFLTQTPSEREPGRNVEQRRGARGTIKDRKREGKHGKMKLLAEE
jgi:hypothetical protein